MATTTLRPDGTTAIGGWAVVPSGTGHEAIDDDPDSPDIDNYIQDTGSAGADATFSLGTVAGVSEATNVDLRVYGQVSNDTINNPFYDVELRKADDTVLATVNFPENTANSLRTTAEAVSLTQSEVDGLKLVVISTNGYAAAGTKRVFAVEVGLTYTEPRGGLMTMGVG